MWLIPDGTDFNTIKTIGTWFTANDNKTKEMPNAPGGAYAQAGRLEVIAPITRDPVGTTPSGAWKYIVQRWITHEGATWVRYLTTNASGEWSYSQWSRLLTSGDGYESGTIASETYGSLWYVYSPTQHIAQVRWAGNGNSASTAVKTYTLPDKLKPRGPGSPFCVLHNGLFMEINMAGTLQLNIGSTTATWSAGFISYITV